MRAPRFLLWAIVPITLVLFRLRGVDAPDGTLLLGHDYSHYFARLYLGADYFWKNGFSVPHFTPYLCGGMPFFADPQSIFYSVQQFLSFFLPGLFATRLTFLLAYVLGYWGTYRLMRERFQTREWVAHLTAWAFTLNGFSLAHLFVGHITHYPFLLAPWLALAIFARGESRLQWLRHLCIFSLVLILTFYTGGLHVLVVFGAMVLLLLPAAWAYRCTRADRFRLVALLGLSSVLFILGTAGQVVASFLFAPVFHTGSVDSSGRSLWELVTRYLWFDPAATPQGIPFGQWMFGAWEYVGFVTKWTLPGLFIGWGWFLRKRETLSVTITIAIIAALIIIISSGGALNSELPFFRYYHNPLKILGSFILPLILLTGVMLDAVAAKFPLVFRFPMQGKIFLAIAFLGLLAEFQVYSQFFVSHPGTANYSYPAKLIEKIEADRQLPPVTQIVGERKGDLEHAASAESSLSCYEPLFGYRGEALKSRAVPGPVDQQRDGAWNMNHPGCLLYSEWLGCQPWDRIPQAQKNSFERFAASKSVTEWVPGWHRALILFSFFIVGLVALGLGFTSWKIRGENV